MISSASLSSPFVALGPLWFLALVAQTLALSICDLLYRRVGNRVALMPFITGVLAHALAFGPRAAAAVVALSLGVFCAGFALWALKIVGGADVKMAAALAACAGLEQTGAFVIYTCLVSGVLSLVMGIDKRLLSSGARGFVRALFSPSALERARAERRTVPLAVALCAGLLWSFS